MVTVAVVTKADGSPLDLETATQLDPSFVGKTFVPSPHDFILRFTNQRVYVVDEQNYDRIIENNITGGVPYSDVENHLQRYSDACLSPVCINDNEQWDKYPD